MPNTYNGQREANNLLGTKAQRRRRYRKIVEELGARQITLEDISTNAKPVGFLDMLHETKSTLDDAVVLQQYAKAIITQDTKAAEFLRDTVGDKPSTQIDMNDNRGGLKELSTEELRELLEELKKNNAESV